MAKGFDELIEFVEQIRPAMVRATIIAGQGLLGDVLNRIHVDGKATDGGEIGEEGYSTTPFYTAMDSFINRGGIPKENISKNRLWVQLPEGYKSFREYSGRQVSFVDLKYTGGLQNSMLLIQTDTGMIIGYPQQMVGTSEGGIGPDELSEILEDQYGKDIFTPSEDEVDNFFSDFLFELKI